MSGFAKLALALTIVGALNWLLVGAFDFDLVAAIFGQKSFVTRAIYIIVGLAGAYCLTLLAKPTTSAARVRDDTRRAA